VSTYYSKQELLGLGFLDIGEDVKISKLCKLYSISGTIGAGTRIDDFTILKGHFEIGKKVHICSHCSLSAVGGKITIGDLCGIGVNNIFYTASDDMLKTALCGPLVSEKSLAQKKGNITLGTGVALGGRVTVMPSTMVGNYSAFGISSVLSGAYQSNSVYMVIKGSLKRIASRDEKKLQLLAETELKGFI